MFTSMMEIQAQKWDNSIKRTEDDYSMLDKISKLTKEAILKGRIKSLQPTIKLLSGELSKKNTELVKLYRDLHKLQQEIVPIQLVTVAKTKRASKDDIALLASLSPEDLAEIIASVKKGGNGDASASS